MRGQFAFTRNGRYVVLTRIARRYRFPREETGAADGKWEIEVSRINRLGGTRGTRLLYRPSLWSALRTIRNVTKKETA